MIEVELKKTFTYATLPSVHSKAKTKAARDGYTLSELIDNFLRDYIKPEKKTKDHNKQL